MELTLESANADMLQVYQRERVILPFERAKNQFLESIQEGSAAEGMQLIGNELQYGLRMFDGYGVGTPNDGAAWSTPRQHSSVKATVTRAQLEAALSITLEAQKAGQDEGSFTGDPLGDAVKNCVRVYAIQKNAYFLGHGTGRLAVIAADAAATDTVILDGPEFAFMVRRGMFLEAADIDVGGTVQTLGGGNMEARVIDIDHLTHTVTFDRNVTVEAGWGLYLSGVYGARKPNGMRAFIDDGQLTDDVVGIVRADHPEVNAKILDNNGQLQDYDEMLLRDLYVQITQDTDIVPDVLWSNEGMRSEHFRFTSADRMFVQTGQGVPAYQTGMKEEDIAFHYGGQRIPFKVDRSMPARSLYALYMAGWRKHTLMKDDWLKRGGPNPILDYAPAAGGQTYSNRLVGSLQGNCNLSHKQLNAQGALLNVKDRHSARD